MRIEVRYKPFINREKPVTLTIISKNPQGFIIINNRDYKRVLRRLSEELEDRRRGLNRERVESYELCEVNGDEEEIRIRREIEEVIEQHNLTIGE